MKQIIREVILINFSFNLARVFILHSEEGPFKDIDSSGSHSVKPNNMNKPLFII